jgi:hypothetical protein
MGEPARGRRLSELWRSRSDYKTRNLSVSSGPNDSPSGNVSLVWRQRQTVSDIARNPDSEARVISAGDHCAGMRESQGWSDGDKTCYSLEIRGVDFAASNGRESGRTHLLTTVGKVSLSRRRILGLRSRQWHRLQRQADRYMYPPQTPPVLASPLSVTETVTKRSLMIRIPAALSDTAGWPTLRTGTVFPYSMKNGSGSLFAVQGPIRAKLYLYFTNT